MKLNIKKSGIDYEIKKELAQMQGNSFQLEDITSLVQRTYVKPRLITALLNPMANEEFEMTDTFRHDATTAKAHLPGGKAYSAYGPDMEKTRPDEYRYSIPSFGIKYNVAPQDYIGRRKPGSMDFLTEADVVAQMAMEAEDAWSAFDELALAQLVTADTNIVRGGPFTEYNFYTDIVGTTRPAATDMDLGSTSIEHFVAFRTQRKLLQQELARVNDSASRAICLCGDTFFNARYEIEKQESIARELRSAKDLVSQAVNTMNDGSFLYDMFDSHDGITYINYGSEIIAGSKLIDDSDGYLIPMGARQLIRIAYAPSQTRQYANTQALQSYAWSSVDDRQGVTVMQESNKLFALINPKSITHLTTSTS